MFAVPNTAAQLTGDSNNWQGYTLRNVIAGSLVSSGGAPWRAYFKAGSVGATVDSVTVNGAALTFSGSAGLSATGVFSSDWNTAAVITAGAPITADSHFPAQTNACLARHAATDTNYGSSYKQDGQSAFTASINENYWFCGLEIQDSATVTPTNKGSRTMLMPSRYSDCLAGTVPSIPANPNTGEGYLEDKSRLEWQDANVCAGAIVALGDSLTAFNDWTQIGAVFNAGVGGEKVEGIMNRVSTLTALHRSLAVVLMIGVNNINNGDDMTTLIARACALIDWLSGSLVVVSATQQVATTQQARTNIYNGAIAGHLAGRANAVFVDLNPVLAPAGVLLSQFSKDGLHWLPAGYQAANPLISTALKCVI